MKKFKIPSIPLFFRGSKIQRRREITLNCKITKYLLYFLRILPN
jgi:hypothetical protein